MINEMRPQVATPFDMIDSEVRALSDRVVDLGAYVEELFKNAISLLFTRDWSSALSLFQGSPDVSPITLNGEAVQLLRRWAPTGEYLRTIMALQHAATEFEELITLIQRIAEKAHSLDADIEIYLTTMSPAGREAFYRLVHSAYVQLRGCVVVLSTRQPGVAQHVINQDGMLDMASLEALEAIRAAVTMDVQLALPMALLTVVVGDIEQIGNRVTRICQRFIGEIGSGEISSLPPDSGSFGQVS